MLSILPSLPNRESQERDNFINLISNNDEDLLDPTLEMY